MSNTDKRKLLFIHNSLPEYRIAFWRELSKFFDVNILITNKKAEKKIYGLEFDKNGLKISYLNPLILNDFRSGLIQFDAVVLPPADRPKELLISLLVKKICKIKNIPFFYWTEKWVPIKSKQPLLKRIKNFIHKEMILCASNGCECYIASGSKSYYYLKEIGVNPSRVEIAYDSSISPEPEKEVDIRKLYNIRPESKLILYLGRLVSRKGCSLLIESFRACNFEEGKVVLLVCGCGEQESYLKKISEKNKNIVFCGKIQPSQRKNYYRQSDLFVLPSYIEKGVIEAWGLTINEALECGLPVISTDAVGASFDLIDDDVGAVVSEGDFQQLTEVIIRLLEKGIDRNNCIKRYSKFSVSLMSNRFYEIISLRRK